MKITIEVDGITYSAEIQEGKSFDTLIDLLVNLSRAAGYTDEIINKRIKEEQ